MDKSMKNFFPIKTDTACQLKWTWSTIYLNNGTTSSCHRVGRHPVALENFDNFHNTPEKLDQRNTMLRGEWPQPLPYMNENEGCRYCQKIEESGGQSDRQFHSQIPDLVPPELENDPTATSVTPRILEVFLNNTCNLSCTYCNAKNSSQIENENVKFGDFSKNGIAIQPYRPDRDMTSAYTEKFFDWMKQHSQTLRRLHLLGGEPLYQKEFYRCVEFFQQHPNKELEFNVVTNLMIDSDRLLQLVEQWKHMIVSRQLKRFDVTVSLDCWGPEQEYARHGLTLERMEKNIEILLNNPWIYLNINSTLSPLTIRKFSNLVSKIVEWKKVRKINHHFQTVFSPGYHNPDIFGKDFWNEDLTRAIDLLPKENWQEQQAHSYLQGIQSQIQNTCINPEKILQLHTHLDELDRRRGTNWRELFPYLEDYQKYVV
jgi:sulfatase maturation enzyme AslB (radical SAM superfamily)